jgi:hypothetical protein
MAATQSLRYHVWEPAKSAIFIAIRKAMLSGRAHMALIDLENGARLNSVHSVARELIAAEVALDNFGFLEITEFGRKVARAKFRDRLIISDENVADLSYRIDPMANPATAMTTPPAIAEINPFAAEPPPVAELEPAPPVQKMTLEPTTDQYITAMRCAGVATGETGIEVKTEWVLAFLSAWMVHTKNDAGR